MAEKKIQWTTQQKQAIIARDSDVLVTASAGTGKTAVLSGRCVNIISEKCDVRNVLVLTFTEAAAEQMCSRIAEQLKDAYSEKPDSHLRHQLMLLQASDISTIHSFCKRLITENFYRLGLDPTFRVIDGDEQKLLKAEVLEETIDWAWKQDNIQADLKQLLYRRDLRTSDGFITKVIELSDFLDSVISRDNWYEKAIQLAEISNPFNSNLGQKQKKIIAKKINNYLAQLKWALNVSVNKNVETIWAEKFRHSHIEPLEDCIKMLNAGNWNKCSDMIRNYRKPKTYKPKGVEDNISELIHKNAKKVVDDFQKLSHFAILNPEYLDKISGSVKLQTRVLIELIGKFEQLYSQAKKKVNCMDFADLEHYALKLLTRENSPENEPLPSETALALQRRYEHIFVDEFQDINSVQQRILSILSPGGNILEVGDVKQSIYAFRGAEPEIFLEQLKSASIEPRDISKGLRVDLNTNFRSAKGILDFVNKIFSKIMTVSLTGIDYNETAQLSPAIENQSQTERNDYNKPIVEFHILDEKDNEPGSDNESMDETGYDENLNLVNSRQRQAAMIAQRIRQMVGADTGKSEFQIYDKELDAYRDVQYRDIVILMRSLSKKAKDYVEILRLAGVPVSCQATAGYFQATEISDSLSLLKVLDNPLRDIELAAVLRSPFFKVSDTELAKLKIHGLKEQYHGNFYDYVTKYCSNGPDAKLAEKLKKILEQIEQWRTIARRGNLADLIWQIYRETRFFSFVKALPNGQARKANLLKFHDKAIQFEGFASSAGVPSLTRFVEFFEKLQETGQDWAPAEPQTSAGNSVRILSVHKSKGLEFPVVFLAELESKFNRRDMQADCLINTEDTLGLQIIDRQTNSKLSSLAHEVIAEQKFSTLLAEEMRILYVAMTRAMDRIILTASQKQVNCSQIISSGLFFGNEAIPDWRLRECQCPLEWILYGLSDQKILHQVFNTGIEKQTSGENLFGFKLYSRAELKQLSEFIIEQKKEKLTRPLFKTKKSQIKEKTSNLLTRLKKSLDWNYQFGQSPLLAAKTSVTQLTHRNDEYVKFDYSGMLNRKPKAVMISESDSSEIPESRLIGSATHLLISKLDLSEFVIENTIEKVKKKLLSEQSMTQSVAERINTDSIVTFFNSELGRLALDRNNKVFREWPFTFSLPTSLVSADNLHGLLVSNDTAQENDDDFVIVQGIIDLLICTPEKLIIVDFKTDKIKAEQTRKKAELYRKQLDLYGRAAAAILNYKSVSKWLYFLNPCISVEV